MNDSYQPTKEGDFYLYRHIRLDNNQVFYVGIGKKGKRKNGYGQEYSRAFERSNRKDFWKKIVAKAGYRVEILLESNSHTFIKEREIEFIKLYGRRDLGTGTLVNFTDGGEGVLNRIVSEETKAKISAGHKGKIYSAERCKLCKNNVKEWSLERRAKMKTIHENMDKKNTGKCKIVFQYTLEGVFIKEWPSTMEVERSLGIYHTRILEACKRKNNKFKGFIWKFKE